MSKTVKDYAVNYVFGYSKAYGGWHSGVDRPAPHGTPLVVNGVTIGYSGNTGYVLPKPTIFAPKAGSHHHLTKLKNGQLADPGNKDGFSFKSAVVTQIGEDSRSGKFIRVRGDGFDWVHCHLSKVTCKTGQKLVAPVVVPPTPKPVYDKVRPGEGLSHIARRAGYKDWWLPTSWARIAKLNGSSNWIAFNRALKPGQKIRVR